MHKFVGWCWSGACLPSQGWPRKGVAYLPTKFCAQRGPAARTTWKRNTVIVPVVRELPQGPGADYFFLEFECLLFLFVFWLFWLGPPILCWIEVVRVGIFILILMIEENLTGFHYCVMFVVGLLHMTFIMVRYIPLIPNLLTIFFTKRHWNLLNIFL